MFLYTMGPFSINLPISGLETKTRSTGGTGPEPLDPEPMSWKPMNFINSSQALTASCLQPCRRLF